MKPPRDEEIMCSISTPGKGVIWSGTTKELKQAAEIIRKLRIARDRLRKDGGKGQK